MLFVRLIFYEAYGHNGEGRMNFYRQRGERRALRKVLGAGPASNQVKLCRSKVYMKLRMKDSLKSSRQVLLSELLRLRFCKVRTEMLISLLDKSLSKQINLINVKICLVLISEESKK